MVVICTCSVFFFRCFCVCCRFWRINCQWHIINLNRKKLLCLFTNPLNSMRLQLNAAAKSSARLPVITRRSSHRHQLSFNNNIQSASEEQGVSPPPSLPRHYGDVPRTLPGIFTGSSIDDDKREFAACWPGRDSTSDSAAQPDCMVGGIARCLPAETPFASFPSRTLSTPPEGPAPRRAVA